MDRACAGRRQRRWPAVKPTRPMWATGQIVVASHHRTAHAESWVVAITNRAPGTAGCGEPAPNRRIQLRRAPRSLWPASAVHTGRRRIDAHAIAGPRLRSESPQRSGSTTTRRARPGARRRLQAPARRETASLQRCVGGAAVVFHSTGRRHSLLALRSFLGRMYSGCQGPVHLRRLLFLAAGKYCAVGEVRGLL